MIGHGIFEQSDSFLREKNRMFQRYFNKSILKKSPAILLLGHRGVGKTTLIIQFLNELSNSNHPVLYIQADHISIGTHTLYEISDTFYKNGGKTICIDEIHKYQNWSKELKSIVDSFKDLKVIASGSSLLELQKGSHDLSRRVVTQHLYGFSFREFINFKLELNLSPVLLQEILTHHSIVTKTILNTLKEKKILALFKEYLRLGYYPYSQELDQELFFITLEQGIHTSIESDVPSVYPELTGVSTNKIFRLMQILAHNVPYQTDLKKLKNLVQISDDRILKNYLNILNDTGLTRNLYSSGHKLNSLARPEKIYLNNTNLMYTLNSKPNSEIVGTLRETFFLTACTPKHTVFYTKNGDFVLDQKYTFEIGGKNKTPQQIKGINNAFLGLDEIETGYKNIIPLWLFGFLY